MRDIDNGTLSMKEAVRAARSDAGLNGKFKLKLPTTPGQFHHQHHQYLPAFNKKNVKIRGAFK